MAYILYLNFNRSNYDDLYNFLRTKAKTVMIGYITSYKTKFVNSYFFELVSQFREILLRIWHSNFSRYGLWPFNDKFFDSIFDICGNINWKVNALIIIEFNAFLHNVVRKSNQSICPLDMRKNISNANLILIDLLLRWITKVKREPSILFYNT